MKKTIIYLMIIMISFGIGWTLNQKLNPTQKASVDSDELQVFLNIREKCKTADLKGEVYLKKYGSAKPGEEAVNSSEWVDTQSWEQACSDAFQELREQLRVRK